MPVSLIVLLSIAYGAVSLASIIGNSAVLWFVVRSHRLRTVTNIFIGNLAIADILIGALAIPFQFVAALLQRWVLPHFMCSFCPFVQIVSVNVSIFTLAAIAADRYLIVVHPLNFRITKSRAKKIIAIIWTVAIVAALPTILALRVTLVPDVDDEFKGDLEKLLANVTAYNTVLPANITIPSKYLCDNYELEPEVWKWYNRVLVVIQYILPVSILVFAYGKMGIMLTDLGTATPKTGTPKEQAKDRLPSPFNSTTGDPPRPSSDVELSVHSKQKDGQGSGQGSNRSNELNAIKDNRTQSITTNAEYIAANKRRVSALFRIFSRTSRKSFEL